MSSSERKNIWIPLSFAFALRVLVYAFAILPGHYLEGDSASYLAFMDQFLAHGTVQSSHFLPPGYFIFEGLFYHLLGLGHYGVLAAQNFLSLFVGFLLMREVKQSLQGCWVIALVSCCDPASVLYANALMTETLSLVLVTLGWFLAFRKDRVFWGSFCFGLSCVVRAGNWPLYLCFLGLVFFYRRRIALMKTLLGLSVGALVSVVPLLAYNGLRFHDFHLSTQSSYHWSTLGGGIIMRQRDVDWVAGEQAFNAYRDRLIAAGIISKSDSDGISRRKALSRYIRENPGAFTWSVTRGFLTQFFGGQNSEVMLRFEGRNIEQNPLSPAVHESLIAIHALWMLAVWMLFLWGTWILLDSKSDRATLLFTWLALAYFFVSVATLGAPRFRIPCMPAVALCIAMAVVKVNDQRSPRAFA